MKQFTSQYPKDILMSISIHNQTNKLNHAFCIRNRQQCESMMVMKKEKIKRTYLNQGQCSNKILFFISLLQSRNQLQ